MIDAAQLREGLDKATITWGRFAVAEPVMVRIDGKLRHISGVQSSCEVMTDGALKGKRDVLVLEVENAG